MGCGVSHERYPQTAIVDASDEVIELGGHDTEDTTMPSEEAKQCWSKGDSLGRDGNSRSRYSRRTGSKGSFLKKRLTAEESSAPTETTRTRSAKQTMLTSEELEEIGEEEPREEGAGQVQLRIEGASGVRTEALSSSLSFVFDSFFDKQTK